MDTIKLKELQQQISRTIPLIEEEYNDNPSDMLKLIHKRYIKAHKLLVNEDQTKLKKEEFYIKGSSRAYLEVSTDYFNPLLEELGRTEEIFMEVFNEGL